HTLVPLHPLPGPAHRRQAEVRPPPPNSQRKGSRCDRCPCEDHAQLWRAQKQPTQAVCSRRRLHTPVRSPRLEHSSTKASLHEAGGVSPPTSLPACDRRRPHVAYEATYVLAGIPPLALLADERARLYGRRREDAKDEERLATLSKWQEAWDRSKKARWTHRLIPNIRVWIERRHGELNYHLTQLLTGHGFFKHHSRRYDHNQSAQCPIRDETVNISSRTVNRRSATQQWFTVFIDFGLVLVAGASHEINERCSTVLVLHRIHEKTLDFFSLKNVHEIWKFVPPTMDQWKIYGIRISSKSLKNKLIFETFEYNKYALIRPKKLMRANVLISFYILELSRLSTDISRLWKKKGAAICGMYLRLERVLRRAANVYMASTCTPVVLQVANFSRYMCSAPAAAAALCCAMENGIMITLKPLSRTNFLKKVHVFDFWRLKLQTLDDGFEKASDVSAKSS
ncbi:unnamed protein product, partial [Trichogramma brassicae]